MISSYRTTKLIALVGTAALVLYAFSGFLLAPYVIKQALEAHFTDNYGATLRIESLRLNPFSLRADARGLSLAYKSNSPIASVEAVLANLQLMPLFTGKLGFKEVEIERPALSFSLLKNGNHNFSWLLNDAAPQSSTPVFTIDSFRLLEGSVSIEQQLPDASNELTLDEIDFSLDDFGTEISNRGEFVLSLNAGDAGELQVKGKVSLYHQESSGSVELENLQLDSYASWLANFSGTRAQGEVSLKLDYAIARQAQEIRSTISQAVLQLEQFELIPNEDLQFAVDNTVLNFSTRLRLLDSSPELEVIIASSLLENTTLKDLSLDKKLVFLEKVQLQQLELRSREKSLDLTQVQVDIGELHLVRSADGELDWQGYQALLASEEISGQVGNEAQNDDWEIQLASVDIRELDVYFTDEATQPQSMQELTILSFQASSLTNQAGIPARFNIESTLNGQGSVTLDGSLDLNEGHTEFELLVDALDLVSFEPYLKPYANLDVSEGTVSVKAKIDSGFEDHTIRAGLQVNNLALQEPLENRQVLVLEDASISDITIQAFPVFVDIASIELHKPFAYIGISETRELNIAKWLVDNEAGTADEKTSDSKPSAQTEIRIANVSVEEGRVDFYDSSMEPELRTRLQSLRGKMSGLNLGEKRSPGLLELEGRVGEYGLVNINGQLIFSDPKQMSEVDMLLKNIDTAMLSPYAGRFAGRAIESGKLDMQLDYQIKAATVKGENSIVLKDLVLGERVESSEAVDLPLDMAIALLQDKNGRIDLNIPVSGDLNNPKFDLAAVISKALANVLKSIVTAPFKALSGLFGGSGEALDSIPFEPGFARVTPPAREILDNLVNILVERPALAVQVNSGFEPLRDRDALADSRLRSQLVNGDQTGGSSEQAGPWPGITNTEIQRQLETLAESTLGMETISELRRLANSQRNISAEENALEVENKFYRSLYDELKQGMEIDAVQLQELAATRSRAITDYLLQNDIAKERVKVLDTRLSSTGEENWVNLKLELVPHKKN